MKTTKRLYTAKRLYFTCRIKALYMMKEFGVKFERRQKVKCSEYDIFHEHTFRDLISDELEYGKISDAIYVATESERIFEPKNWDLGRCFKRKITANFIDGKWDNGTVKFDLKTTKIIMRNNKQFFEPEVENENNILRNF